MKKIIHIIFIIIIFSSYINAYDVPFIAEDIKQRKINEEIYYKFNKLALNNIDLQDQIYNIEIIIDKMNAYDIVSVPKGNLQQSNVQENLYELDNYITSAISNVSVNNNSSYWEIDSINGGLMTRDTSLVTISDDYWELSTGDLITK